MFRQITIAALIVSTSGILAQTPAPAFEVATIKPAAPSPDGHTHINYPIGDRFSAANITLLALMQWAYNMPEKQILNGPSWLSSTPGAPYLDSEMWASSEGRPHSCLQPTITPFGVR
jgi:hypothetical protein